MLSWVQLWAPERVLRTKGSTLSQQPQRERGETWAPGLSLIPAGSPAVGTARRLVFSPFWPFSLRSPPAACFPHPQSNVIPSAWSAAFADSFRLREREEKN